MDKTVGLIGVGKMGSALLARLVLAGNKVRAFDIKASAMEAARSGGAETVGSAAEAAKGAAIVHIFVHNDEEIFDATISGHGALGGAAPGTTVILHSTIMPATTKRVAEEGARKGVRVIDASVTSVPRQVRAGEATFLVGGPDDVVAEIKPHLQSLGRAVWHFGPTGSGNAAKLAKNLTNVIERVMWAEVLTMLEKAGLDPKQFIDMFMSIERGSIMRTWERVVKLDGRHVTPQLSGGLFRKDAQHAARLARELGLKHSLTQGAADTTARWLAERPAEAQAAAE
ncbi:MAG TPA: NAD(P)-dependent oxidoreductase [Xanthobacteraceae bacterium]|nr:NAD(P)-dependent oxidoreductase [Xanthobacteraceae bacterium]